MHRMEADSDRAALTEPPERAGQLHDDLRPADRAPLHRRRRRERRLRARHRRPRRVSLHARHPRRPATAASSGRCGSSPGSARRRTPTRATRRCSRAGGTGLSVAFDLPTLMGRDPDHELSLGEVGKCGVNVTSLADMETLFDGIAARRHHDVDDDQLAGGDDLRDVSGRRRAAGRRLADALRARFRTTSSRSSSRRRNTSSRRGRRCGSSPTSSRSARREVPRWNTISVSGYHIREAGATALQELAFTLRDGLEYVQWGVDAGLDVDAFVPRMSFFFNAHSDFFEEIAKYRAARTLWARGDARSVRRAGTSGRGSCASTARRPACRSPRSSRTTTSSARRCRRCRRCSAAPTRCTPTRSTRRWRCRPRRRRRSRCGRSRSSPTRAASPNVVDPLGGSYFVEKLTRDMEDGALRVLRRRSTRWAAWSRRSSAGFPQREIAESAYRFQQAVERKEKIIVGVNDFVQAGRAADRDPVHRRDGGRHAAREARARCKRTRDGDRVARGARRAAAAAARRPRT